AGDAGPLVQLAQVAGQVRVVGDAPQVALEVAVVDRVEAHQGGEQPPVRLGEAFAEQVAPGPQPFLPAVDGVEQLLYLAQGGLLRGGAARPAHRVVERLVDVRVDLADPLQQVRRRVVAFRGTHAGEGGVEHADDVGRLVAYDRAALAVPHHRHRHPAAVA